MAEEFEAAGMIYGGNWGNMMNTCSSSSSSLCSIAANNDGGNYFSCSWQTHHNLVDLKSHDSLGFLVQPKQNHQNESSPSPSASGNNNGNIFMDSTLAFALSPSPSSNLLGRPESNNFQSVLEEEGGGVDSSNSEMKTMNQEFAMNHQQNLSSYGLYDDEHNNPLHSFQPEESLFTNPSVAFITYNSTNQVSPTWSKPSDHDHFLKPSSMPKQQLAGFHFSNNNNNNPFWNNASADDIPPPPHVLASSPQSQTFERKPTSCSPRLTKHKREEEVHVSDEPSADAFKRPRIETPSPLPTFRVRKEKLGDRITALQQLVSPFGKTDTASVLHEAIEYIKYLHDQVSVLSAPYLNNNGTPVQYDQGCDEKESKQDLRSQGLCLAPISSTFTLAKYEMMANELWTPAYEGALNLMG